MKQLLEKLDKYIQSILINLGIPEYISSLLSIVILCVFIASLLVGGIYTKWDIKDGKSSKYYYILWLYFQNVLKALWIILASPYYLYNEYVMNKLSRDSDKVLDSHMIKNNLKRKHNDKS